MSKDPHDETRWFVPLAAAILLTATLAGCIGTDGDAAGPDEADEPAAEQGQAVPQPQRAQPADEGVDYVEETRSLTWDGQMPGLVLACTAAGCVYQDEPTTERDNVHEIGTDPLPVAAEFTLTWDDPNNEVKEMLFGIVTDGCRNGCQEIIWKEGTSGVTISVDDVELDPDDGFAVTVHHTYNYYPGDVHYSAGPPVDFTVEGTYTVLTPAE